MLPEDVDSESLVEVDTARVEMFEELYSVENNIQCNDKNEDCDEDIVKEIRAKCLKISAKINKDDDSVERKQVTNSEARSAITLLQRYFMQQGNEDRPMSALNVCNDFVQMKTIQNARQATWHEFFKPDDCY